MRVRRDLGAFTCAVAIFAAAATPVSAKGARYVLRPLALQAGMSLLAGPVRPLEPPLALAANGAVAALVGERQVRYGAPHIVVWRADGTRTMLAVPSDDALLTGLRHYQRPKHVPGAFPAVTFPRAEFLHVVLANDGTPFATVAAGFSGAYSGTDKAVFRWTGTRWVVVATSAGNRASDGPTDFDVAAAELPKLRVAISGDYSGLFVNIDAANADPDYQSPEVRVLEGATTHELGFGRVTSLAGAFASGYTSARRDRTLSDGTRIRTRLPEALLWRNGRRVSLGRGIAFAVNASGVAVGDDRTTLDGDTQTTTRTMNNITTVARRGIPDGVPTLWRAGTATVLMRRPGTAYGIAADGTIVGTFENASGFVVDDGALRNLDDVVARAPREPHIVGAYAINSAGRILVMTVANGVRGVAVLDPPGPSRPSFK
jgi:hypothetical protein